MRTLAQYLLQPGRPHCKGESRIHASLAASKSHFQRDVARARSLLYAAASRGDTYGLPHLPLCVWVCM